MFGGRARGNVGRRCDNSRTPALPGEEYLARRDSVFCTWLQPKYTVIAAQECAHNYQVSPALVVFGTCDFQDFFLEESMYWSHKDQRS